MSDKENRDALSKAYKYITSIRDDLQSKNRFFPDKKFTEYLETIFKEAKTELAEGHLVYRARRYSRNDIKEEKVGSDFEGYDREKSFVNKGSKWPSYGRMNPQGIAVLYVASDVRTAITELHPYFGELYSVAKIRVRKPLVVANLSMSGSALNDDFTRSLAIYVQEWISQGQSEKDYVLPQYISSYCKSLGYDGIAYRSKYATRENIQHKEGINYTIFNYDKCEVIGSKLYDINKVSVQTSRYPKDDNQNQSRERRKQILEYISKEKRATTKQIASALNCATATASKYAEMLVDEGKLVSKKNDDGRKEYFRPM